MENHRFRSILIHIVLGVYTLYKICNVNSDFFYIQVFYIRVGQLVHKASVTTPSSEAAGPL